LGVILILSTDEAIFVDVIVVELTATVANDALSSDISLSIVA
jgi:hypothetical protein